MIKERINIHIGCLGIGDDFPVRIMGVINLSRESFYKGSVVEPELIVKVAQKMVKNGASFLDIGGRSTAPDAINITIEDEKRRVEEALEILLAEYDTGNTLLSIDTQYSIVAEAAFSVIKKYKKENFFILNDISALHTDPEIADWIAHNDKPVILMATGNRPGDSLGMDAAIKDLDASIKILEKKGFDISAKIIVDPAIGRWVPAKKASYDLELIGKLNDLRVLGCPVLVGISRKSFIGTVLDKKNPLDRLQGTLSGTAISVFNGAHIIRTHDVNEATSDTIKLAYAIRNKCIN